MTTEWTRRLWTTNRRLHPRYIVENLKRLHAKVEIWPEAPKMLHTIGIGGCGFYLEEKKLCDSPRIYPFKPKNPVFISFELDGVTTAPINILGDYAYRFKVEAEDGERECTWYNGIKFVENYCALMVPIIDQLDLLAEQGVIDVE